MKKLLEKGTYIILLLLLTITSYGQTYQNPTYGTITTKTAPTATTDPYVSTISSTGVIGKVAPENIPVNVIPPTTHYTPTTLTLKGHFQGLDNAIGNIPLTTAGNTTRIWFTGDATTITAGTFYLTNPANKGTVANVSQSVINDDNQKKYFTQDLIGQPFATATLFPPGVYAGNLSASTTPNSAQQRFTVELYKCNNSGTPIASGVSGAPVGDLGVTVILILDSGLLTLADGSVTNVPVSATLSSQFSIAVGERIRYHVSAEKVGTASSNITESVWYGSSFNSFLDVPTPITSSGVSNVSTVGGATVTNALDNLNIADQQQAGAGVTNGHISDGAQSIVGVKTFNPAVNAIAGIARGTILNPTLTATANNDVLVAFEVVPSFNSGGFTGVNQIGIRSFASIQAPTFYSPTTLKLSSGGVSQSINFYLNQTAAEIGRFFGTSGNFTLQNGGTFTDAGYRLDVTGTTRLNGAVTYGVVPTTSAGAFYFLTGNNSTNITEKVLSSTIATIASPAFTGTPTAPTATAGTNTTQIATTAFVQNAVTSGTYTPTLTNTANTSALTLVSAIYTVVGDVVTVRIDAAADPITANTQTSFTATLPFAMSGAAQTSLGSGTAVPLTDFLPVLVQKNSTTLVNVIFKALTDVNNAPLSVTFSYLK